MKVQVLSGYDNVQSIEANNLKRLIVGEKITAFRRSEGWVKLGIDPVRGDGGPDYDGPERRNIVQKSISGELRKSGLFCLLGLRGPKPEW